NGKPPHGDSGDSNDSNFQDLADLPDPASFPIEALPPTTRQFVREAAKSIGCPVDYIGLSVLAALSAGIGDTRRIVLKKDWTEGAAIFGMIVGGPASKKTPAMNVAFKPIRELQMAFKVEYERQKEEYKAAQREYEKAKKDGPTQLREPEPPVLQRTYADDTTVERLADLLNENRRGLVIIKDELSGWLGAMNQYKQGGKGADRQFWLSVHTNQPVTVDRKSSDEPIIVAHPWAGVIGGIQPEVLPDFGKERGDGLIDRFLPAYPNAHVGRWTDDEISDSAGEGYAKTIRDLYRLRHANDDDDPFPSRVPMTDEAKALFVDQYNKLHEELESPGFPQRLRPAWGKLEAYMARLALILAMTRIAELSSMGRVMLQEQVTREDMAGAVRLLEYFKNHVRRVFTGLYGDSPSDRLAADLREFLTQKGGQWEGIASELFDAFDSDHKPERPEDLSRAVRGIAKRSPLLVFEDLKRTKTRRPFRLTLKNAVIADTAVTTETSETSNDDAPPHEDEPKDEGGSPYAGVNPDVRVAFEKPSQDLRARLREYQMGQMSQTRLCALVSEIIFGNPTRMGDVKPAVKVWFANEERF
nr:YfjI family protein [Actinomycetota bacterium]